MGLASLVALDVVGYSFFVADARARAQAAGASWGWLSEWVSSTPGRASLVLVGLVSVVSFARRPGRLGAGAVALGVLALLSSAHTQLFGSPWRHMFFSGLCLLGWLAGLVLTRVDDRRRDESYAVTGARALLGSAYLSAALSKLLYGGLGWADGTAIQASVINQTGLVADTWLNAYRSGVAFSPTLAAAFAVGTMVVEAAGPALLGPKRIRALAALGLLVMHFNIFVLTGILYWESMVLLVLFGLPLEGPLEEPAERAPRAPRSAVLLDVRVFVPLAALLCTGWVVGVGYQGFRHHEQPEPSRSQDTPAPSPAPHAGVKRIGPFGSGSDLAGWSVSSLHVDDDALRVKMEGPPGLAVFALTCEPSPRAGPFDLGDAHIVYEGDVPDAEVQAIGEALRQEIERATEGRDVCESWHAWRGDAEHLEPREAGPSGP
ncbi:hypothetical protein [Paraliomyxa miuraensis]|uniref:hypothetical protein n=1 Tax=Paraliomyxa miuraensis TaxID=376150 RepID=UPI00224F6D7B|nr:hypothetical protein [Paraliomyxa miuraensis]